jgi:hypothetical protein
MSSHFEELGAPLTNNMWSWGAVRESDKTVFLRVWQDGTAKYKELGNSYYTWVTDVDDSNHSLGAAERRTHVKLIDEGYTVYMVMCQSQDDQATSTKQGSVKDFNEKEVFLGGRLVEYRGEVLLENVRRVPFREAKPKI